MNIEVSAGDGWRCPTGGVVRIVVGILDLGFVYSRRLAADPQIALDETLDLRKFRELVRRGVHKEQIARVRQAEQTAVHNQQAADSDAFHPLDLSRLEL